MLFEIEDYEDKFSTKSAMVQTILGLSVIELSKESLKDTPTVLPETTLGGIILSIVDEAMRNPGWGQRLVYASQELTFEEEVAAGTVLEEDAHIWQEHFKGVL